MKIIIDELCNKKISKRNEFEQFYIFDVSSVFHIHNIPITGNNDIS